MWAWASKGIHLGQVTRLPFIQFGAGIRPAIHFPLKATDIPGVDFRRLSSGGDPAPCL